MSGAVAGKAVDALWWTGWRPLIVGSLGAVAGVVAGYADGAVGPVTAAVGLILVSAGILSPLLRRVGFLSAVVTFVVFFVVGPSRAEEALGSAGLGTGWTEQLARFVLNVVSLVGVEPSGEPTAVVGGALASLTLWSLAGAAAGGVVWLAGAYTINSLYAETYHDFTDAVEDEGRVLLGGGDAFYTFTHGEETVPLVRSAKKYNATNLLVGDSSLSLHHGSTVDMVARDSEVSDSTKELYYDQVASVDYEEPYLKIRMSDGQVVRIVTSGKPVDVIAEIEGRLQTYKGSPASDEAAESEPTGQAGDDRASGEPEDGAVADETGAGGVGEVGEDIMEDVDEALDAFETAVEEQGGDGDELLDSFGGAMEGGEGGDEADTDDTADGHDGEDEDEVGETGGEEGA